MAEKQSNKGFFNELSDLIWDWFWGLFYKYYKNFNSVNKSRVKKVFGILQDGAQEFLYFEDENGYTVRAKNENGKMGKTEKVSGLKTHKFENAVFKKEIGTFFAILRGTSGMVLSSVDGTHWKNLEKIPAVFKQNATLVFSSDSAHPVFVGDFNGEIRFSIMDSQKLNKKDFALSGEKISTRGEDNDPNRDEYYFDYENVSLLDAFRIDKGILVLYESRNDNYINIGGVLIEQIGNNLRTMWRSEVPLAQIPIENDFDLRALGGSIENNFVKLKWKGSGNKIFSYALHNPFSDLVESDARFFSRYEKNPILSSSDKYWESVAVFNPAAVLIGETVHLLYRAVGENGRSYIGHAVSRNGFNFIRGSTPAFCTRDETHSSKEKDGINFRSPTIGIDGAEDPRATLIDGRVHMMYAAFNGYEQARTAGTSISVQNLVRGNYDKWEEPIMLSPPPTRWGTGGKNAAFVPQKISNKYAILHRIWPNIHIDFTGSADLSEFRNKKNRFLEKKQTIFIRPSYWDSGKIAVGPPPIEIEEGWLLLYIGVSQQQNDGYKVGAMILERENPEKVLYRTTKPVLSPREKYEKEGHTANVVYPCGAVVKDGTLFVYYGAADTRVCVATQNLREFVEMVKNDSEIKPKLEIFEMQFL